jgi:hypothetical protein
MAPVWEALTQIVGTEQLRRRRDKGEIEVAPIAFMRGRTLTNAFVIVDEAQNLSPRAVEELRMLSNFQVGTRSLVQSFLVGQPEFRGIMQRPEMRQLKQRVIASYHLGPLDAEETQFYIEHRLKHVGWTGNPAFDPAAFVQIHTATEGVPRRINTLCDRLLLAAYLGDKQLIGAIEVESVADEMEVELGGTGTSDRNSENTRTGSTSSHQTEKYSPSRAEAELSQLTNEEERSLREQIVNLEERVALLESSNGMMFNLIRKILRVLRTSQDHTSPNQFGK